MAEVSPFYLARMIRLALTILGLVLQILVERGKTKEAREAAARYEDFKFALKKGDTDRAGVILREQFRRVLSSQSKRPA